MTFDLRAQLLVDLGNWQSGLTKASKQMSGFGKSMKTISNGVKAAFAGLALVGIKQVGDAIVDVTKAYQEDEQSQRILAATINNSIKGHQKQKKTVEENITAWQTLSNVQDDKIRPAYAYLILATKSITKSNRLMAISLDLAAGRNIDLKTAASAVGRAYAGNLLAINKLLPGVKNLKDPLAEVERRFKGLAALSAANDPFTAMNIVMDEFKEKLGKSFLPLMKSFAKYMQSKDFQAALDDIANKVQEFGKWFTSPEGQETFKGWMSDLKQMISLASEFLGLVIEIKSWFTPAKPKERPAVSGFAFDGPAPEAPMTPGDLQARLSGDTRPAWERNRPVYPAPLRPLPPVVNQYITVNGVVSGNDVVKALRGQATQKGRTILGLLGN